MHFHNYNKNLTEQKSVVIELTEILTIVLAVVNDRAAFDVASNDFLSKF